MDKFTKEYFRILTRGISLEYILKMGALLKKGHKRANWRTRWFILCVDISHPNKPSYLLYYKGNVSFSNSISLFYKADHSLHTQSHLYTEHLSKGKDQIEFYHSRIFK